MFQLVVDNISKLSKALKKRELKEKKEKDEKVSEQTKSFNPAHNWFDGFLLQKLFQEEMKNDKSIFKEG